MARIPLLFLWLLTVAILAGPVTPGMAGTPAPGKTLPVSATPRPVGRPPVEPGSDAVELGSGAHRLPVLLYHHLAPADLGLQVDNAMVNTVEQFSAQMAWLADACYYTPDLAEVEAFVAGTAGLPENSVLITFDDGYEALYHYAHPILEQYGLRAVVFIIGNRMGGRGAAPPDPDTNVRTFAPDVLTYLDWAQLTAMTQSGRWQIANHTFAGHQRLDDGQAPLLAWDKAAITADLRRLDQQLVAHGLPETRALAYPWGYYDEAVMAAVSEAGAALGFTVAEGCVAPADDPLQLQRLPVYPWHRGARFQALVRCSS